MKTFYILTTLFLFIFAAGCSSGIHPDLQAQIDLKSYSTEELQELYEDLNDELVDVIEEKNYNFKKLIKAKDEFRTLSTRRYNRQTRLTALESPEVKEGEALPQVKEGQLETHRERLAEYDEEIAEAQVEVEKYTAITKELTEKAVKMRTARNKAYDAYIASREDLKALHEKAKDQKQ
ncbi:MAG: hypothetical protein NE327_20390 [Lentisphaeraceae bacterium]|nr:hypothetical protein [Lentisphaeraceae bacterium]